MKRVLKPMGIALVVISLFLTGCSSKQAEVPATSATSQPTPSDPTPKEPEKLDAGETKDGVYTNKYFGLTLKLPSNWVSPTDEEMADIRKMGQELLAGSDENLKKVLDVSEMNTVPLVTTFKYPQGTPGKLNPSFALMAEKIPSGIKSGEDMLTVVKDALSNSELKYDTSKPFFREKVSGIDFNVFEGTLSVNGVIITQKYYAAIKKNYAIEIVITTFDKSTLEDTQELQQILDNLTINP